jgi:hypothetical protein
LPLWFREGLVEYLDAPGRSYPGGKIPAEGDLRQTSDPDRARRAYAEAAGMVARMVQQRGESTVLRWVATGVPNDGK